MGSGSVRVAVAQLSSRQDVGGNLEVCRGLVAEAARWGCELIAFPENTPFLGPEQDRLRVVEAVEGPIVSAFQEMARSSGVAVLLGSFAERGPRPSHSWNTSVFIDERGEVLGRYRKIHLFDVDVQDGPRFLESESVEPGDAIVTVDWRGLRFGLTICYDLRFPELYRQLWRAGAQVLCIPAAFTERTGRDHWEVLLRARAIENQCWVLAPNQWGHHSPGRSSYGHSMIIDPWGSVSARSSDGVGLAVAEIGLERVASVRGQIPCHDHARLLPGGRGPGEDSGL